MYYVCATKKRANKTNYRDGSYKLLFQEMKSQECSVGRQREVSYRKFHRHAPI